VTPPTKWKSPWCRSRNCPCEICTYEQRNGITADEYERRLAKQPEPKTDINKTLMDDDG